ncbi:MAG TPA: hypothetical protein VHB79_32810 [Polyangiaceae bacterium]|nr:hypothetical protein [Polyangiaceae bacterium]
MRSRCAAAAAALACSLLGCGDFAAPSDSGVLASGGGGGGGATSVAGSQANGSAGATAGSAGSGGALGATPPVMACSTYADKSGYQLVVHIQNQMSRTLYLGQDEMSCNAERLFQVEDGARHVLPSLENCHTSCDQMMTSGPATCPLVCQAPATIKLDPNQTLQVPWDGRFGVMQTLPQACLPATQTAPASCVQADRIGPAIFTFSAKAGSSMQCLTGTCTCTPNQAGGCSNASSLISGTIYTTEYVVKLEPGETSPSGEGAYIGLVFKDTAQ